MNMIKKTAIILPALLLSTGLYADQHENKMQYFKNAQKMDVASLNVEGVNAFLQDIVSSNTADSPMTCGLFRMEKGNPLEYTYTYEETKIIVEGEMTMAEDGGDTVDVKPGDVVHFDEGAKITFTSNSYGLGFFCGQRKTGEL